MSDFNAIDAALYEVRRALFVLQIAVTGEKPLEALALKMAEDFAALEAAIFEAKAASHD